MAAVRKIRYDKSREIPFSRFCTKGSVPVKVIKWIAKLLALLLAVLIAVGCVFAFLGWREYRGALEETGVEEMAAEVRAREDFTPLEELPDFYLQAVVAVEDQRFYEHGGVDFLAILRAVWNDLRTLSLAEGGSTITQQTAKNLWFSNERTPTRKVAEILMAWQLESYLDKDEILELYVNSIFFGDNCYSVGAASRHYFGKEPGELTDGECAALAGIPNAPSVYAPTANPDLMAQRQQQVLRQMVKQEIITQSEMDAILAGE